MSNYTQYLATPWKLSVLINQEITIDWLVEGLIPDMGKVLLVAQRKTGKTLLAMQMGLAGGEGVPFLQWSTFGFSTVYVDLENGPPIMYGRAKKMADMYPVGVENVSVIMMPPKDEIYKYVTMVPGVKLVVVDPAISLGYTDENSSALIRGKLDELTSIVQGELGASVMIVHHTRKPPRDGVLSSLLNESRGSSAFLDWADTNIAMGKAGEGRFKIEVEARAVDTIEPFYIARNPETLTYSLEGPPVELTQELLEITVLEYQMETGKGGRPSQEEIIRRLSRKLNKGRTWVINGINKAGGYKKYV